ncbi:MAG: hypothetical protein J6L65_08720 [Lachnospiraceae bacterium]|nr:hypothetical protein [Lachnospiraceae bacterium]
MTSMYNLMETAGTDLHRYDQKIMSGVETTKPCETIEMLIREIKEGSAKEKIVKVYGGAETVGRAGGVGVDI